MSIDSLSKTAGLKKKRVGRGIGSGKGGHTTGRGNKGQKARERVHIAFEGTKFKKSLLKRVPFLRGKGKLKSRFQKTTVLSLDLFKDWNEKHKVTMEELLKQGFIKPSTKNVKILGSGEIEKKLVVEIAVSLGARKAIEKAGGQVVE